jgi:hypothetical protein
MCSCIDRPVQQQCKLNKTKEASKACDNGKSIMMG